MGWVRNLTVIAGLLLAFTSSFAERSNTDHRSLGIIAYIHASWSDSPELYLFDVDKRTNINISVSEHLESHPEWTSDGISVVYQQLRLDGEWICNYNLLTMVTKCDNTICQLQTKNPIMPDFIQVNGAIEPQFSPDGTQIVYAVDREGNYNYELYLVNADGTQERQLTDNNLMDFSPVWSPNGEAIAFVSERDRPYLQLFLMHLETGEITQLTFNEGDHRMPAWRPTP